MVSEGKLLDTSLLVEHLLSSTLKDVINFEFLWVDPGLQKEPRNQTPAPSAAPAPSSSKYHRARSGGARDERYRSDIHTEAVQAALAKHKEQKMALPMPTKRRSTFVQSPADTCTPPGCTMGKVTGCTKEVSQTEIACADVKHAIITGCYNST
ncbi:UNVERIFIED_CONTAM: hypothetical protein K2H54_037942 [Gekko kuhli]